MSRYTRRDTSELMNAIQLGEKGRQLATAGRHNDAIVCFNQALGIFQKHRELMGVCAALDNLGLSYMALDDTTKAIEYFERALIIARESGSIQDEGRVLGNLGTAQHIQGILGEAKENLEVALKIAQQTFDKENEEVWLRSLGGIHADLGQFSQAIPLIENALLIAQENSDLNQMVLALEMLGSVYYRLSNPTGFAYPQESKYLGKAKSYYEQAISIVEKNNLQGELPTCLIGLGLVQLGLNQFSTALQLFQKAASHASKHSNKPVLAMSNTNAGLTCCYLAEIEPNRSLQAEYIQMGESYLKRAVDQSHAIGRVDDERNALVNLAAIYLFYRRDFDHALSYYLRALDLLDMMRYSLPVSIYENRSGLLRWRENAFKGTVWCYVNLDRPREAFVVSEQARSQDLFELLGTALKKLPQAAPELLQKEHLNLKLDEYMVVYNRTLETIRN